MPVASLRLIAVAGVSALALAACSNNDDKAAVDPSMSPEQQAAAAANTTPIAAAQAMDVLAAQGKGFAAGKILSTNAVYVLFDPQCPHCARLWEASLPLHTSVTTEDPLLTSSTLRVPNASGAADSVQILLT